MKKIVYALLLLFVGSMGYSQNASNVNTKERKKYLMETYKIHRLKVEAYDKILMDLQRDNDALKSKQMTSTQFQSRQRKLYEKYGDKISQIFSKGRYRAWNHLIQDHERYLLLSETKLISRDCMHALYKAESEWEKKREHMLKSSIPQNEKLDKEDMMLEELNNQIQQILGADAGQWYIAYKKLEFETLSNMDKYGASYKDAYAIARIENDFRRKRAEIFKSKKNNADKEVDFINNDRAKERQVFSEVSAAVATRWKKVDNAALDNILSRKYGMTQFQIADFKKAYNKYIVGEYNILSQKAVSSTDKYKQLLELSDNFQERVKSFFRSEDYLKWQGWWLYDFRRKMKRKGFEL